MGCKPKPKCAGALRQSVLIQEPTRPSDGSGGQENEIWTDVATIRAHVRQLSGDEAAQYDELSTVDAIKITTRYRDGLSTIMRAVFRGREYNIRRIDDLDFEKRWLEIYADGGVDD